MRLKAAATSILALGLLAGSTVGVTAQENASSYFTWTLGDGGGGFREGTFEEWERGWQSGMTMRDFRQSETIEADDPRAAGLLTWVWNSDSWADNDPTAPQSIEVMAAAQRLDSDGGSWVGSGTSASLYLGEDDPIQASLSTLTGEGGYDGLTLILLTSPAGEGGTGLIVPTVPPMPELPAE